MKDMMPFFFLLLIPSLTNNQGGTSGLVLDTSTVFLFAMMFMMMDKTKA